MGGEPEGICGYTWDGDGTTSEKADQQSCCYREAIEGSERCIWHAKEKTAEELADAQTDKEVRDQTRIVGELLDGAILTDLSLSDIVSFTRVSLRDAEMERVDLEGENLAGSNLAGANLRFGNFRGADLSEAELSGANLEHAKFPSANLSNANLPDTKIGNGDLTEVELRNGDLSGAHLQNASMTDALLSNANLSGSDLKYAELDDSSLNDANLVNAELEWADLSRADLDGARLTYANLRNATLSEANLRNAELSYVDLREGTLRDLNVNSNTTCERLGEGFQNDGFAMDLPRWFNRWVSKSGFESQDWDATARACNDMKTAFSDCGMVGKARDMHVHERRARGFRAKTERGWRSPRYLSSVFSRVFTGYGVRVRNLLVWMSLLFLISTAIYVETGVRSGLVENISYSVLAFTVAPPDVPSGTGTQIVMMIETFFGTLSTVLLGYILGNREQF